MNSINDDILDNKKVNKENSSYKIIKIIYILFSLTFILIIGGFISLYFLLRKKENNDTKTNTEIVTLFFKEGYQYKNYDKVMTYMVDNYIDHSPANARSNKDAVNILKLVGNMFSNITVELLDLISEKDMVAARIYFKMVHSGEYNKIPATGKTIIFEALENFKVVNGKITESWGYWPDNLIEGQIKGE